MNKNTDHQYQFDIQMVNSEEIQDIITAVPSWIIRRGILLIFGLLALIILGSAFIHYPDVVKTSLKVNSLNAPKSAFAKQTGKITSLLVQEGTLVKKNDPLAFMESTANHEDVISLHKLLNQFVSTLGTDNPVPALPGGLLLGELQGAYQNFYQQYLLFISTQQDGYYITKKKYLQKDLIEIKKLKKEIITQSKIQEQEYSNIEQEYESYKKLYQKGVISKSEFKLQENKYLSSKQPLNQVATSIINNNSTYTAKEKEIFDLDHTIQDEKSKFIHALNNMLNETDVWMNQYMVRAPVDGKVTYAGIIQENQTVSPGTELFIVSPNNSNFFGEVHLPQSSIGKIRLGQKTLVKMRSYPFEQYGMIKGNLTYISDAAFRDSIFIAKISFSPYEKKDKEHNIILKNGMQGDAEIITEECSLLQRFMRNITKTLNNNG